MTFVKKLGRKTLEVYKLYTWTFITVMLLNQLLFFGFCLNPICIIAAMPHVLLITVILGTFINKMETKSKETTTANIYKNQSRDNRTLKEILKSDASLSKTQKTVKKTIYTKTAIPIDRSEYLTEEQISKINGRVHDAISYDRNMEVPNKYSNSDGLSCAIRADHKKKMSAKFRRSIKLKLIKKQNLKASKFKQNI